MLIVTTWTAGHFEHILLGWVAGHDKLSCLGHVLFFCNTRAPCVWVSAVVTVPQWLVCVCVGGEDVVLGTRLTWKPCNPALPSEVQGIAGRGKRFACDGIVTICCFRFQSRLLIAVSCYLAKSSCALLAARSHLFSLVLDHLFCAP